MIDLQGYFPALSPSTIYIQGFFLFPYLKIGTVFQKYFALHLVVLGHIVHCNCFFVLFSFVLFLSAFWLFCVVFLCLCVGLLCLFFSSFCLVLFVYLSRSNCALSTRGVCLSLSLERGSGIEFGALRCDYWHFFPCAMVACGRKIPWYSGYHEKEEIAISSTALEFWWLLLSIQS